MDTREVLDEMEMASLGGKLDSLLTQRMESTGAPFVVATHTDGSFYIVKLSKGFDLRDIQELLDTETSIKGIDLENLDSYNISEQLRSKLKQFFSIVGESKDVPDGDKQQEKPLQENQKDFTSRFRELLNKSDETPKDKARLMSEMEMVGIPFNSLKSLTDNSSKPLTDELDDFAKRLMELAETEIHRDSPESYTMLARTILMIMMVKAVFLKTPEN